MREFDPDGSQPKRLRARLPIPATLRDREDVMSFVADLEPEPLWRHFDRILTIPRGSKNEERIRRYVVELAEESELSRKTDDVGNVVVFKPASAGAEDAAITVLQSHLDMVNEKNEDVDHDFESDPIEPVRDGDYLTAAGTTLGSDNGIGVAAMLAVMEDDGLTHGPLELLFTIDEETGLTGAANLGSDMLEGRRLINLDSEEEGSLYVGCAGGGDTDLSLTLEDGPVPDGARVLRVRLAGFKGGHSGVDIHLQRANAVKQLARVLHHAFLESPFRLASIRGGDKHNAIPREATATVVLEGAGQEAWRRRVEAEFDDVRAEFSAVEPDARLEIEEAESPASAWPEGGSADVLALLVALPHGVMSMSYDIPDLVETSTNLATVRGEDGSLRIGMSSRSSVASSLSALRRRIRATASLAGAEATEGNGYPGWKPDMDSPILATVRRVHEEVLGDAPEVKAVHAGLECGIIGEKFPGIDMISFGPQIEYPHSPDERVEIGSVKRFYRLLTATLEELATG